MRYIELNPVRAAMVASPEAYRWSSYRRHALGEGDAWLADLGSDRFAAQIESVLGCRMRPGKPGRPRKKGDGVD